MYYYAHHLGGNKNEREKFKGHKYYNDTIIFVKIGIKSHLTQILNH